MDAKRCDRCGAFYQPENWKHGDIVVKKKIKERKMLVFGDVGNVFFIDESIDLCPGCSAFIKDWLTNKEN